MEKILDELLELPVCHEVTEEQLNNTAKGLQDGTFDPDDMVFELEEIYHKEDSGLNSMATDPPNHSLPKPPSSESSGYYSGSSEGSLSPPDQCRDDGKDQKNSRKQKYVDIAKVPNTLDTISEESEKESRADEGLELTEENDDLEDNLYDILLNEYKIQYADNNVDIHISVEDKRKLECLGLLQTLHELDQQLLKNS